MEVLELFYPDSYYSFSNINSIINQTNFSFRNLKEILYDFLSTIYIFVILSQTKQMAQKSFQYFLILFIFSCLFIQVSASWQDYDTNHTINCSNLNNSWTLEQNLEYLWNILILHPLDRYFFLIASPAIIILQAFIIFTIYFYKLYKNTPMDIILACFVSEISINISYFSTAIYYSIYPYEDPMPCSFPTFCLTIAIVNTFFTIMQRIYLVYFLLYVILGVQKSLKKQKWFGYGMKHIIALVISGFIVMFVGIFNWYGLTQFGFCSITSTRNSDTQIYFPILELSFAIFFVIVAIYSRSFFLKYMPEGEALNKRKFEQNSLITKFVIGMSIITTLFSTATFVLYLNCINPQAWMLAWATAFNILKMVQFSYMIVVMLTYKKLGNKVKKLFRTFFSHQNVKSSFEINEKRLTKQQALQFMDIGMKQKILDIQQQQNQIDFVTITQIMTILMGIKIAYKEYLSPQNGQSQQDCRQLHFYEQLSFQIDPRLVKQYDQQAFLLPRLSLLKGKFTIYASKVFKKILQQDFVKDLWKSFDLLENKDILYSLVQFQGGKSGQFFFFTSDNKYLLKTVNQQQFNFLLQYLQDFYNHFIQNPNSLITRIYGMFKIQNKDISQIYYILLMKNLGGCGKEQIIRTYDMKGSTDDRQILNDNQEQQHQTMIKNVLKDLDFNRLEGQIEIDSVLAKELRNQLRIDTSFLTDLNIIDYSLLLMRVNWKTQPENQFFWKKYNRMPSTVFQHQYYHLSLIDYLQKWDLQKQGEKCWKNLFGKKDTSSQQPTSYQQRFMKFITKITSCSSDRGTLELQSISKTSQMRQTQLIGIKASKKIRKMTLENEKNQMKPHRSITVAIQI